MAGSIPARLWGAPLWAHAGVLLIVLCALLPLMSPNSSFSSDERAYALQVEALERGSWTYDYKAERYDPGGRNFPIHRSTRSQAGYFTYVKHPAYPLLLQAARRLAGPTLGLHLLALLGTVGTAGAAWLLAAELGPRLSRPGFWMAASGPVLVNGFLIWAHAPSAALAGFALVGAARIARRGFTPLATAGVGIALAAGVLLRTEGLLFAAALVLGLAWVRRGTGTGAYRLAPLLLAVPTALVVMAERAWVGAITGRQLETLGLRQGEMPLLEGRILGAWHELFGAAELDIPGAALPVLVAFTVVVGLGYIGLRRSSAGATGRTLTVVAAATPLLLLLRLATHPYEPVTGLLVAWPVMLLGVMLFRPDGTEKTRQPAVLFALTTALFVGAVLITQYPEGGATEWGGRFLSPVLAPLAVLAVAGLARAVGAMPPRQGRRAGHLLAGVAVVFSAFALVTVGLERARVSRVSDALVRHPAAITVTTQYFAPRATWPADDKLSWMQVYGPDLPRLMDELRSQGVREVAVVVPQEVPRSQLSAFPRVQAVDDPDIRAVGMRLFLARA